MPADAPEVVVRAILTDEWNPANTLDITPNVHMGWLDPSGNQPEVTVSNPEESPVLGADTGFRGIAPDGSPTKDIGGTVMVNVWASRDRTDANPRQLVHLMKEEVRRIIDEVHHDAPTSDDLIYLSFDGGQRRVEQEDDPPVVYRFLTRVGYGYSNR